MRRLRLLPGHALAAGAVVLALSGSGCQQQSFEQTLPALQESGRISFVCLGPSESDSPFLPLRACRNVRSDNACDFSSGDGGAAGTTGGTGGTGGDTGGAGGGGAGGSNAGGAAPEFSGTPHLYGLVTQTFRGEVALIDLTSKANDRILDQDPSVPGPSFLPVGDQPVGIVSTPGGTASFVTVAEVGREGIFAIPSLRLLRPRIDPDNSSRCVSTWDGMQAPPRLSSWPACSLPAAPGEPLLLNDPADTDGFERASCDDFYSEPPVGAPNGDLTTEGQGRQKLIVPIPSLGGFAVIDAQTLLDRPDGSFDPCPVDRWVLLDGEVPVVSPPAPPSGDACVGPAVPEPKVVSGVPLPGGLTYGEDTLYLSDLALPVIHRYDVASACEPTPLPPLLPYSIEDPSRVVTTGRVSVTPHPTAGLKRYLYATDIDDRSVMVFDVSDGAATRTPLTRTHPEWTPTEPRDRIRVLSTPRDILIATRDLPRETPGTGVAPEGTFCDPSPDLKACSNDGTTTDCDPATLYRTADDYSGGAG
ncbi:MAG: hypothetical protein R3B70_49380, partial [Polyangiaceae bacterium]